MPASVTLAGVVLAIVTSTGLVSTVPENAPVEHPEVLMSTNEIVPGHQVRMENGSRWTVSKKTVRPTDTVVVTLKGFSGKRPPEVGYEVPADQLDTPIWYVGEIVETPTDPGPEPTPEPVPVPTVPVPDQPGPAPEQPPVEPNVP